MACAMCRASTSGRQIEIMFSSVSGTTTTTVISTASANSHLVCSDTVCWRSVTAATSLRMASLSCTSSLSASANSAMALVLMRLAMVALS